MATAGKVAPTPKDKFVNGTAYDKLDVVEYNGTLYIAKKASAGVLPTDTEYWMLAVDLTGKLDTTGDTENNTVTFESGDTANPTAWKNVATLTSKEKHSSLFSKISTMFSNVRYLYKLIGTTDISALGTVTQAIATIKGNIGDMKGISSSAAITTQGQYALDAREKNASVDGTLANELSKVNSNLNNWVDITSQCNMNTEYMLDSSTSKNVIMVNEISRLLFISFETEPGIPNQANYVQIPTKYIPSYISGYYHHNGLRIGMHTQVSNGMTEEILLNASGEIRSSHSTVEITAEKTVVNVIIPY